MRRPTLIAGWRRCYKLTSVRAAALLLLFSLLQTEVLPWAKLKMPPDYWPYVAGGFALVIAVFRVLSQPGVLDEPKPEGPNQ